MPREIPDLPPDWDKRKPQPDSGHSYEIELITPMVGGGATAGKVDPDFPIRPTSIRGQLQFWWRATVGAQYATSPELRAAQSAVWGDTTQASRVQVRVANVQATEPRPCALIEWDQRARRGQGGWRTNWQAPFNGHDSALPYALFPFQGETPPPNRSATVTKPPASCIHNASFRLTITSHKDIDFAKQVEPAVWAWVNFGGVGARIRRGCGALRVIKESTPLLLTSQPDQLLKRTLREMPAEVQVFQAKNSAPHLVAWDTAIGLLKKFRQQLPVSRGAPRRKFPEAETLRRITGVRGSRNRPIPQSDMPSGFPRAELGLPIVFQFKDGSGPDGMTALPHGIGPDKKPLQRMGSPVILKPIPVSSTHSLPTIIVLRRPKNLTVDVASAADQPVTGSQFANYSDSPLVGSPNGSAIEAFIKFSGFTEVTR